MITTWSASPTASGALDLLNDSDPAAERLALKRCRLDRLSCCALATTTLLHLPAKALLLHALLDEPEVTSAVLDVAVRAMQAAIFIGLACFVSQAPRYYWERRSTVQLVAYVAVWALHCVANGAFLALGARQPAGALLSVGAPWITALATGLLLAAHAVAMPISAEGLSALDLALPVAVVAVHAAVASRVLPTAQVVPLSTCGQLILASLLPALSVRLDTNWLGRRYESWNRSEQAEGARKGQGGDEQSLLDDRYALHGRGLSMRFTDAAMEREFSPKRFALMAAPQQAWLALLTIGTAGLGMPLLEPAHRRSWLPLSLALIPLLTIGARRWLSRMVDQRVAQDLATFGWMAFALVLTTLQPIAARIALAAVPPPAKHATAGRWGEEWTDTAPTLYAVYVAAFAMSSFTTDIIFSRRLVSVLALVVEIALMPAGHAPTASTRLATIVIVLFGVSLVARTREAGMRSEFLQAKRLAAMEATIRRREQDMANNTRRADSRLNHVLKNKSGEALFLIEEICETLNKIQREAPANEALVTRVLDSLSCVQLIHEQTVEWTHERELFMQLQHGTYRTSLPPTSLRDVLYRIFREETKYEVATDTRILCVDASVLRLQLEEGRSNAVKYREPGTGLVVRTALERALPAHLAAAAPPADDGLVHLERLWLHVMLDNQNAAGVAALTPEECLKVFGANQKGSGGGGTSSPTTSDGIGLDTVTSAARAVGGHAWLSTYAPKADGCTRTVFHVLQPCSVPTETQAATVRRQRRANTGRPASSAQRCRGHGAGDKSPSTSPSCSSGEEDSSFSRARPDNFAPVCYGLDDSEILQRMLSTVFAKMGADPRSKSLGSTEAEQESFVPLALGEKPGMPQADIVVLDQKLSLPGVPRPDGTLVARELHERGFKGLIAIHSGFSQQELEQTEGLPYVHKVITKGNSVTTLASVLMQAHATHVGGSALESLREADTSFLEADASFLSGSPSLKPLTSHPPSSSVLERAGALDAPSPPPNPSPLRNVLSAPRPNEAPLVDLTPLAGFDSHRIRQVIGPFFCDDQEEPRAAEYMLSQLEADMGAGRPVRDWARRLCGDARSSGAAELAGLVTEFAEAPSAEKLEGLRACLKRTTAKLEAEGVL